MTRTTATPPLMATVGAMASFQIGAAVAKTLFPALGADGAAALRLGLGAAFLLLFSRPWRNWPRAAPIVPLLALGVAMAVTILTFYLAVERLPLAAAIALQFLGPLSIAVFGSRRGADLVWAGLAAAGVWLLVGSDAAGMALDPVGVAWALAAAAGWAGYILLGRRSTVVFGGATAALALTIAAVLVAPFGASGAIALAAAPQLLPAVLVMALFSSVIPFSLEFFAMARLPARTFAVMTCLEPAFGVVAGLAILGEALAWRQALGVAAVMSAAAGAAWRAGATAALPRVPPPD